MPTLWRPTVILFLVNACIMVIEIVAGRMVAPLLGVSLYTWTSVIGVVLAGISAGSWVGGRMADMAASRLLLGRVLFASSFSTLTILTTILMAYSFPLFGPLPLYVVTVIAFIFFLPAFMLGMVSPLVVRLALADLTRTGTLIGTLYAASTLGSIVGTFATGFALISLFGTRAILTGVALLLALLGLGVIEWGALDEREHRGATAVGGGLLLFILLVVLVGQANSLCLRESRYFCINILEEPSNQGETVSVLLLDRLRHTTIDPQEPSRIDHGYGYKLIFARLLDEFYPPAEQTTLNTLFIGGGGYNLPAYIEAHYTAGAIDVLEIDPAVTQISEEYLGLTHMGRIRTINDDARMALRQMPATSRYDLILGDVFNDIAVPYHLTTVEFTAQLATHLREDGLYFANIVDGREGRFLRAYLTTLHEVFPNVYLIPTEATWRTNRRSTFFVVASRRPLPLHSLVTEGPNGERWQALPDNELARYLAEQPPLLLRDDFAPTDNLLAPVFAAEAAP